MWHKGQFQKGKTRADGSGRKKGTPNKLTKTVREVVLDTFNKLQEDDRNNLTSFAERHPREFYAIAAKLIPTEIQTKLAITPEYDISKLTSSELKTLIALTTKIGTGTPEPD